MVTNDGLAYTNDRNKAVTGQLAWTDKFQRLVEAISPFVAWNVASFIFPDRPALSMRWRKNDDGSLESISYKGSKKFSFISCKVLSEAYR